MKYAITIVAVGALLLAAAGESYAQKGYGYGYGGYGNGCPSCGGYGQNAGLLGWRRANNYGYGNANAGYYGNWNHHRYWGYFHNVDNVPVLPPPAYMSGPPTAAVTYPYYTTRGPRDFLLDNPPSIGP